MLKAQDAPVMGEGLVREICREFSEKAEGERLILNGQNLVFKAIQDSVFPGRNLMVAKINTECIRVVMDI